MSEQAFVARERELGELQRGLSQALEGHGQVVLIAGEAGSGKSALVHEFARRAQQDCAELVVAVGSCNAQTGLGDPYLPFREVLRLLSGDVEADLADNVVNAENASRLRGLLLSTAQVLVEVSPDLVSLLLSGIPGAALATRIGTLLAKRTGWAKRLEKTTHRQAAAPIDPSLDQSRIFEQYTAAIHALAKQRPLLIALDDVQWADAASIGLLFHLGREIGPGRILLLAAFRPDEVALGRAGLPHPLEKVLSEFKRYFGDITLSLDKPAEEDGLRFVNALVDSQPNHLSREFRQALYRHTEGHPLFTLELLRDLQERGDLVLDRQGCWQEGPSLHWDALPARVEGVIEERIQRLDPALRDMLAVASVEGDDFVAQVIAQVQGMSEREALRVLSKDLEKRHHLVREQAEVQVGSQVLSHYRFEHSLFQQYLYNRLGAGERRLLHGQIGHLLEEFHQGHVDEFCVQLARHYAEAHDHDKAVYYLLRAGDQARSLYAHQEAIAYYQRALDFLREQGQFQRAARTLMKLGLTYIIAFDFPHARAAYEEGFALWQRSGEGAPQAGLPMAPHAFRTASAAPETLDPALAAESVSSRLVEQLFRGLVEHSPEGDVMPDLARSWDVLEDGRRYVFHLHTDATWSDGTAVTAADFEFAWRRVLDPATGSESARMLYDVRGAREFHAGRVRDAGSVGVRARDAGTLEVELEGPTSYFLQLLTYPALCAVPRHVVQTYGAEWTHPANIVTNGPFRMRDWQQGQYMVLARNADYRGRFSGNLQQAQVHFIPDPQDRLSLYEADRLDVLVLQTPAAPERDWTRQRHAEEYVSGPSLSTVFLSLAAARPPLNDARVRRALAMAVNRESLADVLARGFASPALGGLVPPGMPGHSSKIGLPFDPAGARQLLAEAGYPAGRGFPHLVGRTTRVTVTTDYLKSQWRENLGIEVEWQGVSYSELSDLLAAEQPALIVDGWIADYPDPDDFLRVGVQTYQPSWRHSVYERLVEDARRATDQRQRLELYVQADRILVEEAVIVPISYSRLHLLIKPWVTRFPMSTIKYWFFKDVVLEPH